ncbi:addiction module antidote protein [Pelagerythrobacter aerophilus]|uniref:Putative addiction module antidote protein n=1 Tax=Pelagerythrobacter aerophilus TaxID=2306995 RepID=A0A418NIJ7_9SPHN|nr:addiction module antidote protein [Pelagerythrobacter aerophilus]RIV78779.1 putative addiction module antidote protein [Pelagerythrobacter aerophilus]
MISKIETAAYDAADYLNGAEDVVAYIDAYREDGSPEETRAAMGAVARTGGISELAKRTGMSGASLSKVLGANGNPSFETVRSMLHALGLRLTVKVLEQETN